MGKTILRQVELSLHPDRRLFFCQQTVYLNGRRNAQFQRLRLQSVPVNGVADASTRNKICNNISSNLSISMVRAMHNSNACNRRACQSSWGSVNGRGRCKRKTQHMQQYHRAGGESVGSRWGRGRRGRTVREVPPGTPLSYRGVGLGRDMKENKRFVIRF